MSWNPADESVETWNPADELLDTYRERGFLGTIHKILAITLSISPNEDATELEELLEFCMTAYAEQTEAVIKQRIKARVKNKLKKAESEAQKVDELPPYVTQLEPNISGPDPPQVAQLEPNVLGKDRPQVTKLDSLELDLLEQDPPQIAQVKSDLFGQDLQQVPQLVSDALQKDPPPVPQMESALQAEDHPQSLLLESEIHLQVKAPPNVPELQSELSGKDSPQLPQLESDVLGGNPPQSPLEQSVVFGKDPPQSQPEDAGVFGEDSLQQPELDTDLDTQVSEQAKALPHIPMSLSESQIKSSCYNPSARRRRYKKHQRVQPNQSSPNCAAAGFIKDEDGVHLSQNCKPEVSEPEGTSEARPAIEDCEAMHRKELLRVTNQRVPHMINKQGFPVHTSTLLEESESSEDLSYPGSDKQQMIRPGTQNDIGEEMIFNNGLVNSTNSESHNQLNESERLVISHYVIPDPTMAIVENSSHLPLEPKTDLGCGPNGEARTPDHSLSAVTSTYDIYEDKWSFISNTFVTDKFEIDELAEPNMEMTSCGYKQGGVLSEHGSATKEPVEEDVKPLLQDEADELVQSPSFEKSSDSERYFEDLLQAMADNSGETGVESLLSCESSFIPIYDQMKNDQQSRSDICFSSSEVCEPKPSGRMPTWRRSSSQSTDTNRTYVIEESQDSHCDRPYVSASISACDGTVKPLHSTSPGIKQPEPTSVSSFISPCERTIKPLHSTSPGQADSKGVDKLSSHSIFSEIEVHHSVRDREELSSSHSLTSVASDATVQLSDLEQEERSEQLKSPLQAWKKRFSSLGDFRLESPNGICCALGKLPRILSAPASVSRLEPTKATQTPTLPPISESVVFHESPTPPVTEKGIATIKSQSLPSLDTTAKESSSATACSFETHILEISPIKIRTRDKRTQRPNRSRSGNGRDRNVALDGRVVGKPPPSPSPSKTPRHFNSQTGSRSNSCHT